MTYAEACEIIDKIAYKPDFRIILDMDVDSDLFTILISRMVDDIKNPIRSIPIILNEKLTTEMILKMNERNLLDFVMNMIKKFELHEALEWFSYKGNHIFDPHEGEINGA